MGARTASKRGRAKSVVALLFLLWSSHARAQANDLDGIKHWQLGEPAPVGYHVARKHTLGIVGGSILAAGYGLSALYGLVFLSECYVPAGDGRTSQPCPRSAEHRTAPLLFIPVAGPFLTFTDKNVRNDGGAVFWFSVFGTAQAAGAVLLAYDLAVPRYGLKRGDGPQTSSSARPRWLLAPVYLNRGPGLLLTGQF
ncbi:MAG: hypothetical protein ABW061_10235 [Polyangiaceae bacterium]